MKRLITTAEMNFGGVYTLDGWNRLRRITTICCLRERGIAVRHPHAGDVLSPLGLVVRRALMGEELTEIEQAEVRGWL